MFVVVFVFVRDWVVKMPNLMNLLLNIMHHGLLMVHHHHQMHVMILDSLLIMFDQWNFDILLRMLFIVGYDHDRILLRSGVWDSMLRMFIIFFILCCLLLLGASIFMPSLNLLHLCKNICQLFSILELLVTLIEIFLRWLFYLKDFR